MEVAVRQAKREDAVQMLQVYNNFTKHFVGSASRTIKSFRTMMRRRDNINWVALDSKNRVIGYVFTRLDKKLKRGEFREVVVEPDHDLKQVAKLLVEKANATFMEKKVSTIIAGSVQNPIYEELFPALGFFESESSDVFMYAVLNVQKFLNELLPVFISRLKQFQNWNGLLEIECEGHSLFIERSSDGVHQIVWTNQPVNLRVMLNRELLIKLLFGLANPVESHRTGQLKVETTEGSEKTNQLLTALFPERRFLVMDYW